MWWSPLGADRVTPGLPGGRLRRGGGGRREERRSHRPAPPPRSGPFKCAVLPLSKKLGEKGREIQAELSKYFMVDYDDAYSIGKRYRREDEIGTPYCITVDFQTVGDDKTPRTTPSRSGTVTPWSRCVPHQRAGRAGWRKSWRIDRLSSEKPSGAVKGLFQTVLVAVL